MHGVKHIKGYCNRVLLIFYFLLLTCLLSIQGATIADLSVTIAPAKDYQLPPEAVLPSSPVNITQYIF